MSFIPNSFQLPNAFVDIAMKELSPTANMLYVVIVRKTRGWQKNKDAISLTQFETITGLSRKTVIKALGELIEYGFVKEYEQKTAKSAKSYALNDSVFSTLVESPLVEKFHRTSGEIPLVTSGEIPHTKTTIKTTIKNNTHTHAVGDENEWSPNLENLKAVLSTTRFSHLVNSIVGMPDFKFHLGNFNAHWENKTSLTENQKTRKFAQWITLEFEKSQKQATTRNHGAKTTQTLAQQRAAMNQNNSRVIDVTDQQFLIEGNDHA